MSGARLDFAAINAAARRQLPALVARWLPDGTLSGNEYTVRNPTRGDREPGSFKINLSTGTTQDLQISGSGLAKLGLTAATTVRTPSAANLQGQTLTIGATAGGTATSITFGTDAAADGVLG